MASSIRTAAASALAIVALVVPATSGARVAPSGHEAYPKVARPVAINWAAAAPDGAVPAWTPGRPCRHGFGVITATGRVVGFVTRYGAACISA
jgi:hypothetical protein